MKSLRVTCPAKVNLFLRVLGKRPDGYHEIETLFQAISLYDELFIYSSCQATVLEALGCPELESEDNLIIKALRWVERNRGGVPPVRFVLNKRIPIAAGLGGGSSNAAGALMGLNSLFDLGLTQDELRMGASRLGADVSFFLSGGTAIGEGVGERISPVSIPSGYAMVLLNQGFRVSTAAVYNGLGLSLTALLRQGILRGLLEGSVDVGRLIHNDLQPVSERLWPEIGAGVRRLKGLGFERTLMSGSGPTVFGLAGSAPEAAERIMGRPLERERFFIVTPVPHGVRLD